MSYQNYTQPHYQPNDPPPPYNPTAPLEPGWNVPATAPLNPSWNVPPTHMPLPQGPQQPYAKPAWGYPAEPNTYYPLNSANPGAGQWYQTAPVSGSWYNAPGQPNSTIIVTEQSRRKDDMAECCLLACCWTTLCCWLASD